MGKVRAWLADHLVQQDPEDNDLDRLLAENKELSARVVSLIGERNSLRLQLFDLNEEARRVLRGEVA